MAIKEMDLRVFLRKAGVGRFLLRHAITPAQRFSNLRYPDRDVIIEANGSKLKVFSPRKNLIGRALYKDRTWEPQVTATIEAETRAGMIALDVGADIGYYALQFSHLVGNEGRVIAFEPIPAARERLEQNIALNGRTNIVVSPYALGNQEGHVFLEDPFTKSRLNLARTSAGKDDISVSIKRMDDLIHEMNLAAVDIIKMDIEGAEHEALRGMEQTLRRFHPLLIVEVHNEFLPLFGSSAEELFNWLSTLGYEITSVDSDGPENALTCTVCCRVP